MTDEDTLATVGQDLSLTTARERESAAFGLDCRELKQTQSAVARQMR